MPPASKKKRPQNVQPSEHTKRRNLVNVSMEDYARCWWQGQGVGCGVTLARSICYEHSRKEDRKRKDGECETQMCKCMLTHVQDQQVKLDELAPEFLAARNLMLEFQALAASRNGGIEVEEPPREELGLPTEEPPIEIQDADGGMMEDIIQELDMERKGWRGLSWITQILKLPIYLHWRQMPWGKQGRMQLART